jgi:DNA polymerase III subunit beta
VKIVVPAAALASALSLAGAALRASRKSPVLDAARLVAADGAVSITGSGSTITITAHIAADVAEPGEIAVSADRLAALVAGFPPAARLAIGAGTGFATITCGNSKSRLPLIDDLPQALALDLETGRIEISASDLMTLLSPLPAADNESTRYYLHGVHWCSDAGKLIATASNGSRLLRTIVAADGFTGNLILPSASAAVLSRIVRAAKPGKVTLRASTRLLAVDGDGFSFTSQLIDYPYPDTSRVIPQPSANFVLCHCADLLTAIQRLVAVATTEAPLIALSFDGAPSLHASLARQPNDGSDMIDAETTGSARVVVSPAALSGMLSQFEGARVRLDIGDDQRPVLIHGDDGKLALLMCCRWNFNRNGTEAAASAA